jgi:hypothetical protein
MVPYEEAYGEGFEELGRRRPDTTALEQMTGWRSTLGVEEAIDDVAAFERLRAKQARMAGLNGEITAVVEESAAADPSLDG